MNILYVRSNFPKLTETFLIEEVAELKKLGHRVNIVSHYCELSKTHPKVKQSDILSDVKFDNSFLGTSGEYKAFVKSRLPKKRPGPFRLRPYFVNPYQVNARAFCMRFFKTLFGGLFGRPFATLSDLLHFSRLSFRVNNLWIAIRAFTDSEDVFVPDVIHCPFATVHNLVYAFKVSRRHGGIPFTVCFRAQDLYSMYKTEPIIRKCLVHEAVQIVTISETNRRFLAEKYPKAMPPRVVHSSIDPNFFVCDPLIQKRKNKIVAVARFIEKKGLRYLIQACAMLKEQGRTIECSIIGQGPLENILQGQIIDTGLFQEVTLYNSLSPTEIRRHLNEAELFVLPCIISEDSNRDMLPNSVKEAMSMELSVITSNICGIEELVVNNDTGILIEPASAAAIAEKAGYLFDHPELSKALGQRARKKILRDFNVSSETAKLVGIFEDGIRAFPMQRMEQY